MVGSNPHVDKALLKELSMLLDPRGDDGYLKKEEFIEIGLKVNVFAFGRKKILNIYADFNLLRN